MRIIPFVAAPALALLLAFAGPANADKLSNNQPATGTEAPETAASTTAAIDWGDDTSKWANDGECDDPRFQGTGSAAELVADDQGHDATDCQAAFEAGTVSLVDAAATSLDDPADPPANDGDVAPQPPEDAGATDFGDDESDWANDGQCDDPRFEGSGVSTQLLEADRGHDATDCRAAVEAGTATFRDADAPVQAVDVTPLPFDYGTDTSRWANDGECDDKRFVGEGTDKKLLSEDTLADATDCRTLEAEGQVSIRPVFQPDYPGKGPYDASGIEWGDNTSSYADDGQCDDPRFEGPGAAATLLDSDLQHDSADCRTLFEAGRIALLVENGNTD